MNKEKLLELAKECDYGITGYIHNGSNIEYEIWGGSMETHKLDKFAELIIEQCRQVSLSCSHREDDMGAIIARSIDEHFGIKS
jgi:hypothetical protein